MTTHQFKLSEQVLGTLHSIPQTQSYDQESKNLATQQQQIEFILKKTFESFLENPSTITDKIKIHISFDKIQEIPETKQLQVQFNLVFNPFYILTESFLRRSSKQKDEDIISKIENVLESYRFKYKLCSFKTLVRALRCNNQIDEVFPTRLKQIQPSKYYYFCKNMLVFDCKN